MGSKYCAVPARLSLVAKLKGGEVWGKLEAGEKMRRGWSPMAASRDAGGSSLEAKRATKERGSSARGEVMATCVPFVSKGTEKFARSFCVKTNEGS